MYESWPAPLPDAGSSEEMALVFEGGGRHRLLILPPLFHEASKLRRHLCQIMRQLAASGIGSVLPDLPGSNESLASRSVQTLENWRNAAGRAASHFGTSHVLAIRSGSALAPANLPGWLYAPQEPAQVLRDMARAQGLAEAESGGQRKPAAIIEEARDHGAVLAGWHLGAQMVRELQAAEAPRSELHRLIGHDSIGGAALWVRAEPAEDIEQAGRLTARIVEELDE